MKYNNICKFIPPSIPEALTVSCFVLEGDASVMSQETLLKENRMTLVMKGSGRFIYNGISLSVNAGDLIFGFKGDSFTAVLNEGSAYIYVSFDGLRGDELLRRFGISGANRIFSGFDGLIPLWNESLTRADAQTVDLASESILLYTFSRLSGVTVSRNGAVSRMIELAEAHFTDPALTLESLAIALSYNPKYLSHTFKESMGIGFAEYLRTLRIKYAVSLFDRGIDSVKNVALLSGFTDPLYFSTVFKNQLGVSPKEYLLSK